MAKPSTRTKLVGGTLAAAIALVGTFEGVRLTTYRDVVGVPTVCFGETRGVHMGDRYTLEECQAMLGDGLRDFEQGMRKCLVNPDSIPDKSYVAFLSTTYNIGISAFCGSSMAKRLNAGDVRGACNALTAWVKAGGKVIKGLVKRRAQEQALCLEGLRA